jgi:hypothetical protein
MAQDGVKNANPFVRIEAMKYFEALYRWQGDAVKNFYGCCAESQRKNLDESFKAIDANPEDLGRLVRSELIEDSNKMEID